VIPASIESFIRAAHKAPSADNSQPWRLIWDAKTLAIAYDAPRIRGTSFEPFDPGTLLAIGGCLENLLQFAEDRGASPECRFSADLAPGADHYVRVALDPATLEPVDEHPLFLRHTNRFGYQGTAVAQSILDTVSLLSEGSARLRVIDARPDIARVAGLVCSASEIRFQTREVHEWLGRSLRFTAAEVARGDGLDVQTLDLPPGGGLLLKLIADWRRMALLNRVGTFRLLAAIDAKPVARAPALVAIIGQRDARAVIDAGRLMTRAWISLNAQGVAVHPYYVVADQLHRLASGTVPSQLSAQAEAIAEQARELFDLAKDETLHMVLRIGYPTREPVRSRRLSIAQVLSDRTVSPGGEYRG
jgi:hypothetical protein